MKERHLCLWLVVTAATFASGCSRSPSLNVMGSFFPAWLLCIFVAVPLTYVCHLLLARWEIESEMKPLVLVYPSMAATFTFVLWLIFFS
jgi:hypothetical protein